MRSKNRTCNPSAVHPCLFLRRASLLTRQPSDPMFRSYLKTALRTFRRQKAYSFINVFGLAIGMACCLLILRFVQHEYGVNKHFENVDSIALDRAFVLREGADVTIVTWGAMTLEFRYHRPTLGEMLGKIVNWPLIPSPFHCGNSASRRSRRPMSSRRNRKGRTKD